MAVGGGVEVRFNPNVAQEVQRQLRPILARTAADLARDGTKAWQGAVDRNQTGRMRRSLRASVERDSLSSWTIRFYARTRGFYYAFQRGSDRWTQTLVRYLQTNTPSVLRNHVRAAQNAQRRTQ